MEKDPYEAIDKILNRRGDRAYQYEITQALRIDPRVLQDFAIKKRIKLKKEGKYVYYDKKIVKILVEDYRYPKPERSIKNKKTAE